MKLPFVKKSIKNRVKDSNAETEYQIVHVDKEAKVVFMQTVKSTPHQSRLKKIIHSIATLFS